MKDNRWIGARPFVFEDFGNAADGGGGRKPKLSSPSPDIVSAEHGSQREATRELSGELSGELSRELNQAGSKQKDLSSGRVIADEDSGSALSLLREKIQELDLTDPHAVDFLENLRCASNLESLNQALSGNSSQKKLFREIVDLHAELYHLLYERTYVGDGYDKSGRSGDIVSALDRVLFQRNEPL